MTTGQIGANVIGVILPASTSLYELLSVRVTAIDVAGVRTETTRAIETVDDDRLATFALLSGELLG